MLTKRVLYSIIVIVSLVALSPRVSFGAEQFNRDLSFGLQQDSDVTKLQEFLSDEGLYSGPITGNFFSLTLKAVKAFQSREGIMPAAGYFGPKTRTRASELFGTQTQTSNQQAATETGQGITQSVASQTTDSSVTNTIQSQLQALLSQVSLLQQQLQIQQQTQQSIVDIQSQVNQQNQIIQQQQQVLQQIQPQPNNLPPLTPIPGAQLPEAPTITMNWNNQEITRDRAIEIRPYNFIDYVFRYAVSYPHEGFQCSKDFADEKNEPNVGSGQKYLRFAEPGTFLFKITCLNANGEVASSKALTIVAK
jgi:peptidoglycan hydrolase-like protein with peptidoglycan-binding domain